MRELKIDISKNKTKNVFDFFRQGKFYNYVITVCDESSAEKCPIFPGVTKTIHWNFEDPSAFTGTYEEILDKTRIVRDQIMAKIQVWVEELRLKHSN
jgi:arsenate reductase